jgi:hypothetical protein
MSAFLLPFLFLLNVQVSDSAVEWISPTTHDFGDLKRGKPVTHDFRFKNTGSEPLTIDNVRSTCGCTATEWSEEVVPAGEEGVIKIEYDAKKEGYFYKKITVFFSGQRKPEKLYVEGYVE